MKENLVVTPGARQNVYEVQLGQQGGSVGALAIMCVEVVVDEQVSGWLLRNLC